MAYFSKDSWTLIKFVDILIGESYISPWVDFVIKISSLLAWTEDYNWVLKILN